MKFQYRTRNTCSSVISFDIQNGVVTHVTFTGGCNGNLKAVSALVDGMTVEEIEKKMQGNHLRPAADLLPRPTRACRSEGAGGRAEKQCLNRSGCEAGPVIPYPPGSAEAPRRSTAPPGAEIPIGDDRHARRAVRSLRGDKRGRRRACPPVCCGKRAFRALCRRVQWLPLRINNTRTDKRDAGSRSRRPFQLVKEGRVKRGLAPSM